jgi:hypothetical protein
MADQADRLFVNYPEIREIWNVIVPHQYMIDQFLDIKGKYGMEPLAKLIHDKCFHPYKPKWLRYALWYGKVGENDDHKFLLLWSQRKIQLVEGHPLVIKSEAGLGLVPVELFTSGFVMDPNASDEDRGGNRRIIRV